MKPSTDIINTVLLVDDDSYVIDGLKRQLRNEPYRILSATSGPIALEILSHEKIDVIISDEQMPSMTGAELVSRVRKNYPHIICMMLSGNTNFDAAIRAINEGEIYRFLKKPCDPLDIATDIRLALEQKDLMLQTRKLIDEYQKKISIIKKIEEDYPSLFELPHDETGRLVIEDTKKEGI